MSKNARRIYDIDTPADGYAIVAMKDNLGYEERDAIKALEDFDDDQIALIPQLSSYLRIYLQRVVEIVQSQSSHGDTYLPISELAKDVRIKVVEFFFTNVKYKPIFLGNEEVLTHDFVNKLISANGFVKKSEKLLMQLGFGKAPSKIPYKDSHGMTDDDYRRFVENDKPYLASYKQAEALFIETNDPSLLSLLLDFQSLNSALGRNTTDRLAVSKTLYNVVLQLDDYLNDSVKINIPFKGISNGLDTHTKSNGPDTQTKTQPNFYTSSTFILPLMGAGVVTATCLCACVLLNERACSLGRMGRSFRNSVKGAITTGLSIFSVFTKPHQAQGYVPVAQGDRTKLTVRAGS
jgi:hypothetical protein